MMEPRQLTNSQSSVPYAQPTWQIRSQQPPHQPKQYFVPPPPRSTFSRGRQPAPVYSLSNNSYHPDMPLSHTNSLPPVVEDPNVKPVISYSARSRSSSSTASSATLTNSRPPSPKPLGYEPTPTSRYIHMLLSVDSIPKIYNLLAAFFTWILLAGYVLLPGTFTSLQRLEKPGPSDPGYNPENPPNGLESWILERVRNTPLLYIAAVCSAFGVLGMTGLWVKWRRNYVWIINRIFLPGTLNSLAGIISTIVNVYTAQQGKFSLTAIVSVVVTSSSTVICGTLWVVYNNWALEKVREMHRKEFFGGRDVEGGKGVVDIGKDPEDVKMELGESGELVEVHDSNREEGLGRT